MKLKILLLGKNGQVGWELQRTLAPLGEVVALGRPDLDLAEFDRLREAVREVGPQIIVNAAAYTDVDRAESEPELAMAVNGHAPGVLAEEAARIGAVLIHFSTDYVFDGAKGKPYIEKDSPNPLNVYGETKLAGERAVETVGAAHLILRTSWVYSLRRECFVTRVLRRARKESVMKIVDDQVGSPTWCRMVAETVSVILSRGMPDVHSYVAAHQGLFHLASSGVANRYQWAEALLADDPHPELQTVKELRPVKSSEHVGSADRPSFSALDCSLLSEQLLIALPDWQACLSLAMAES